MTKNVLTKMRRWDENIGKLIVFAVTIIIAVGVLGTLAYFYNQSRKTATQMSVLTSTSSSISELTSLNFCPSTDNTWFVSYSPINDQYTLNCSGADAAEVKKVRWIVSVTTGTNEVLYKVNR